MDHEVLRLLIQRKVRDGRLPHDSIFQGLEVAPATRRRASPCDTILAKEQLVMEGTTVRSGMESPSVPRAMLPGLGLREAQRRRPRRRRSNEAIKGEISGIH
jgi:hypothetical protein